MNIIIYPDPNKDLNVNEKVFVNAYKFFDKKKYKCIEDSKIDTLENYINNLNKKIKTITILLDNYGIFIHKNINFILNNKHIKFIIHENDIHFLKSKPTTFKRYNSLRSQLKNNNHIYILAYYWYHYIKLININKKRVIMFPKFIHLENIQEINTVPIQKILLSGSMSSHYPMRRFLKSLNHPKIEILTHENNINGTDYFKYLKNFICAFACCLNKNTPYIINKFFEIPASGCLLLAYDEYVKKELKQIGFKDGENYISCNKNNIIQKIDWICDSKNKKEIDRIRYNGHQFVINNHSEKNRYNLIIKNIR
jgi:hypothetical protein